MILMSSSLSFWGLLGTLGKKERVREVSSIVQLQTQRRLWRVEEISCLEHTSAMYFVQIYEYWFSLGSRSPRMVLIIAPILEDADQSEWILKWCNVFYFHIWLKRHNGGLDLLLPNKYIQTGYIIDKYDQIYFLLHEACLLKINV